MRYLSAITMLILALAIMQPVAAQSFKPDFDAGARAKVKGDDVTALRHWRPLAEQGNARAQYWLGEMYLYGHGVNEDIKQAINWYRKAANQGHADAQNKLGVFYSIGKGVLQDRVMAYVWHNISATRGGDNFSREERDRIGKTLTASERRLALKLSKLCLKKPASVSRV